MRNSSVLIALLSMSGSALAGGFAAPIASQITTLVPPPIVTPGPTPEAVAPAPVEPAQPQAAAPAPEPVAAPTAAPAPAAAPAAGGVRVVTNPATGARQLELPDAIVFPVADAGLNPEYDAMIAQIAAVLQADPSIKLNVVGHTDSTAAESYNLALSQERAKAVADALIAKGVAANRLSVSGAGESQPIADNGTDAGRAMNRRTELVIQR